MKLDIAQISMIDQTLREIAQDVETYMGADPVITSLHRIGDTGVHGTLPLRGIDIRCREPALGHAIERHINLKWEYDPDRYDKKCCLFHDAGTGPHIHIQSHPNTRRRIHASQKDKERVLQVGNERKGVLWEIWKRFGG